ncbi:hypothetical protein ACU4GA_16930 [Methylobacterium oryzae CBMB20]
MRAVEVGVRKVRRDGYRYWKAGIVTAASVPLAASKRGMSGVWPARPRAVGGEPHMIAPT